MTSPLTPVVIGICVILILVAVNFIRGMTFKVQPDHNAILERLNPRLAEDNGPNAGTPEISAETEKRIALLFALQEQERVRVLLRNHVGDRLPLCNSSDIDRIRFAVLKLSKGSMDELEKAVHAAKIDWRDVLVWAGFGSPGKHEQWMPRPRT